MKSAGSGIVVSGLVASYGILHRPAVRTRAALETPPGAATPERWERAVLERVSAARREEDTRLALREWSGAVSQVELAVFPEQPGAPIQVLPKASLRLEPGPAGTQPLEPVSLTAMAISTPAIVLVWSCGGAHEGICLVQRLEVLGVWSDLALLAAHTEQYEDTTAVPGHTYRYRIRGTGPAGAPTWTRTVGPVRL